MLGSPHAQPHRVAWAHGLRLAVGLWICMTACDRPQSSLPSSRFVENPAESEQLSAKLIGQVEAFCGDCHPLPLPASFDQDRWHFEVKRGYEFYAKSGRNDLVAPPLWATHAYYRSRAPRELSFPQGVEAAGRPPVKFVEERLTLNSGVESLPEIACLHWTTLSRGESPVMLASDLRYGHVVAIDLRRQARQPPQLLAQLRNPGRMVTCDFDQDGHQEILIGDLAGYLPADHLQSRLVMLQRRSAEDAFESRELLTGMGRISDVQPADLDGDGRLDLVIAEFGWRDTGRLSLARNVSETDRLEFELGVLDDRPGALNVRLHDFNGDGRVDVAAQFSQEYESLDLYRNDLNRVDIHSLDPVGERSARWLGPAFPHQTIWRAQDLTFGGSGMSIVDLNGDGRMDLLFANGDAYDNAYVSPWHGVQWLENLGDLRFELHRLTDMPGAYSPQAGDFDGDGNLDIVVVSRLPADRFPANLPRPASIVFLHQRVQGVFDRYTLQWDSPFYPDLAVGDFDANGRLDFAVAPGPYTGESRLERNEDYYLSVWWNEAE